MKGYGMVGVTLVYAGNGLPFTITRYDHKNDVYWVRLVGGNQERWYFRQAIEEGLASSAVLPTQLIWNLEGVMDMWDGGIANVFQLEGNKPAC